MINLKNIILLFLSFSLLLCKESSEVQEEIVKNVKKVIALDLVSLTENDNCTQKNFDPSNLEFHWKKNPGRFNNLSKEKSWNNVQMTFLENEKSYSNLSKDSLFFFEQSTCSYKIPKGKYNFEFSLGFLNKDNSLDLKDGIFEIYLDNNLVFDINTTEKKTQIWEDFSVDLTAKKDSKLSLKWLSERNQYLFLGSPIVYEKKPTDKKNVILLVIDAFRTDTLDFYDSKFSITPNLTQMSKDSVVFLNSFSNANWTKPSMFSFFYSDYPSNIGVSNAWFYHNGNDKDIFYSNKAKNLIGYFRSNKYITKSIMNNVFLLDYSTVGYDVGFHDLYQVGKDHIDTLKIIENAKSFVKKNKDKSFFLHVNLNTPHWPYTEDKYESEIREQNPKEWNNLDYYYKKYLSEIYYTDQKVGEFFEVLKKEGIFDESWIVFVSDHGEIFSSYHDYHHHFVVKNGYGHGETHYDEELKIPWVIKYPLSLKNKIKKKVFNKQVSLLSLMPTILGLNNIEYNKSLVKGNDYSNTIYKNKGKNFEEVIFSEGRMSESIRTDYFKYIRRYPGYDDVSLTSRGKKHKMPEELYNLKEDPLERNNIVFDDKNLLVTARTVLKSYSLDKNSFYVKLPNRDNLSWNFDFRLKGQIYKISTEGQNINYNVLSSSKIRFFSEGESLIKVTTVNPILDYSLDFNSSSRNSFYRIGKLGLNSRNREILSKKNLVASKYVPITWSEDEIPSIYNDVKFYNTIKQDKEKILSSEVRNILKSWGYIHQ